MNESVASLRVGNSPPKLGGVAAPSSKCREASKTGADGVVCSTSRSILIDIREALLIRCALRAVVEQTTPALRATPPNLGGESL